METFGVRAHPSLKRQRTLIITLSISNICPGWWVSISTPGQLMPIDSYHSDRDEVFPWQPGGQRGQLWYNEPQSIVTDVATRRQGDIAWVVIIWRGENPSRSVSWDSLSLLTPHWPSGHCLYHPHLLSWAGPWLCCVVLVYESGTVAPVQ